MRVIPLSSEAKKIISGTSDLSIQEHSSDPNIMTERQKAFFGAAALTALVAQSGLELEGMSMSNSFLSPTAMIEGLKQEQVSGLLRAPISEGNTIKQTKHALKNASTLQIVEFSRGIDEQIVALTHMSDGSVRPSMKKIIDTNLQEGRSLTVNDPENYHTFIKTNASAGDILNTLSEKEPHVLMRLVENVMAKKMVIGWMSEGKIPTGAKIELERINADTSPIGGCVKEVLSFISKSPEEIKEIGQSPIVQPWQKAILNPKALEQSGPSIGKGLAR